MTASLPVTGGTSRYVGRARHSLTTSPIFYTTGSTGHKPSLGRGVLPAKSKLKPPLFSENRVENVLKHFCLPF